MFYWTENLPPDIHRTSQLDRWYWLVVRLILELTGVAVVEADKLCFPCARRGDWSLVVGGGTSWWSEGEGVAGWILECWAEERFSSRIHSNFFSRSGAQVNWADPWAMAEPVELMCKHSYHLSNGFVVSYIFIWLALGSAETNPVIQCFRSKLRKISPNSTSPQHGPLRFQSLFTNIWQVWTLSSPLLSSFSNELTL